MRYLIDGLPEGLDSEHYIYVPQHRLAVRDCQIRDGIDREEVCGELEKMGLRLTPIRVFLDYFMNVRDAVLNKRQNCRDLKFVNGERLNRSQVINLWDYLCGETKDEVLTWLDGRFKEDEELNLVSTRYAKSGKLCKVERQLKPFLYKDGYVPLKRGSFNREGMPLIKAEVQEYQRGENIAFKKPYDDGFGCVPVFEVHADVIFLRCDWEPGSVDSVGVIPCVGQRTKASK